MVLIEENQIEQTSGLTLLKLYSLWAIGVGG